MKYLSLVQLFALLSVVLGSPIDSRSVDCTTDEQLARAKASRDGQVSANKEQVAAVAYAPMVEVTSYRYGQLAKDVVESAEKHREYLTSTAPQELVSSTDFTPVSGKPAVTNTYVLKDSEGRLVQRTLTWYFDSNCEIHKLLAVWENPSDSDTSSSPAGPTSTSSGDTDSSSAPPESTSSSASTETSSSSSAEPTSSEGTETSASSAEPTSSSEGSDSSS